MVLNPRTMKDHVNSKRHRCAAHHVLRPFVRCLASLPQTYPAARSGENVPPVLLFGRAVRASTRGQRHLVLRNICRKNLERFSYYKDALEPLLFADMVNEDNLDRWKVRL